jgi:integrase/recombinase XerD
MNTSAVYYMVNRVVKRCGINKKIGTHTFRRSRATHLLNMGVVIDDVKDLLRHKNIQTTTVYKKMATDKLKERIDKAEDR